MKRCFWVNQNPKYISYHDKEWGIPSYDDSYLFEMLVLESFQAGLTWECILNKRDSFSEAFDSFDYHIISKYDSKKIEELMNNVGIIRNRRKIIATIENAKVFMKIQDEYSSFSNYIWSFVHNKPIVHKGDRVYTHNSLSDKISKDLKKAWDEFCWNYYYLFLFTSYRYY